jgi:hypothetical protein
MKSIPRLRFSDKSRSKSYMLISSSETEKWASSRALGMEVGSGLDILLTGEFVLRVRFLLDRI